MLPVMAAGLSSIIFSIAVDVSYLNTSSRSVEAVASSSKQLEPPEAQPPSLSNSSLSNSSRNTASESFSTKKKNSSSPRHSKSNLSAGSSPRHSNSNLSTGSSPHHSNSNLDTGSNLGIGFQPQPLPIFNAFSKSSKGR